MRPAVLEYSFLLKLYKLQQFPAGLPFREEYSFLLKLYKLQLKVINYEHD